MHLLIQPLPRQKFISIYTQQDGQQAGQELRGREKSIIQRIQLFKGEEISVSYRDFHVSSVVPGNEFQ